MADEHLAQDRSRITTIQCTMPMQLFRRPPVLTGSTPYSTRNEAHGFRARHYRNSLFPRYTGLAIGGDNGASRLYAADFHNNKIDMFDSQFQKNSSERPLRRPSLPAGFAPFGIQAIGSDIVVAYAKQDSSARISVHASGHGVIDIYDGGGTLKKRLVTGGDLNVPWGIASAPSNFGPFSNKLLIGNFGDAFGNGLNAQPTNPLFFAAGPNRGTNGE
ncbi:MAG TPA: TIGR03118 family protein [Paraburkholderia sp.]|uniref:TIGR03118 family protein n=1 Tax=Burkholderia pyrrocinia TaxID=60550 RepID=UPI002BFB7C6A|nr:TIGR03118 family protein [Paraburkholderia sp.]